MYSLIAEAHRIPSIEMVVFTGGECFLLGADLDGLIAHAHELQFRTRVVTNGYWAVNERAARRRVAALRRAGLDEMMLSTGTFHQKFVPVERVIHAARATSSAGLRTRIAIETCDQQTFDDSVLRRELADAISRKLVYLGHDPWLIDSGGRGRTSITHKRLRDHDPSDRASGRCTQVLDTITVTPAQKLLACCGFPMEQLPRLSIGSVEHEALDDVLRRAPNQLLTMWMHVAGPRAIESFVARYLPGYALPESVSICDSCVTLHRDSAAMRVIGEHGSEIVDQVFSSFVQRNGGVEQLQAF